MSRKRKPGIVQPCLTPVVILNHSEVASSSTTAHSKPSYMIFCWIRYCFITTHRLLNQKPSQNLQNEYREVLATHSLARRCYAERTICSVVPLPNLNPACSLRSLQSIPLHIRSITILPNILLTTGRRVTLVISCTLSCSPSLVS